MKSIGQGFFWSVMILLAETTSNDPLVVESSKNKGTKETTRNRINKNKNKDNKKEKEINSSECKLAHVSHTMVPI